jgi:hypothetical protein
VGRSVGSGERGFGITGSYGFEVMGELPHP